MIYSWSKFEFGVWFLYFRSRDSREKLNEYLGYTRTLKYEVDVSILVKNRSVYRSRNPVRAAGDRCLD